MAKRFPGRRWPRFSAGGPTNTPSHVATGTAATGTGPGIGPEYGTNAAGDRFLMQIFVRNQTVPPGVFAGWSLEDGPDTVGPASEYLYQRNTVSTGGESGTVVIPDVTGNSIIAVIHTFRDWSGVIESKTAGGEASSPAQQTVEAPSVTAGGVHRLAVCTVGVANNGNTIDSFTGESGGDWTEAFYVGSGVGSNCEVQLQTAPLAAGGTISGGTCANSDDEYVTHGFALVGT
jgi:hypothetical protein